MLSCVDCSARPSAFSDAAGHTAVIKHSTGTKIRINLGKEAAEWATALQVVLSESERLRYLSKTSGQTSHLPLAMVPLGKASGLPPHSNLQQVLPLPGRVEWGW